MGLQVVHPKAPDLVMAASLHESVIGGFWQDLADFSAGFEPESVLLDEVGMQLYELAEGSGLKWPSPVPFTSTRSTGKKVVFDADQQLLIEQLELLVAVRSGQWAHAAEVARRWTPGVLSPSVPAQLRRLSKQGSFSADDAISVAAQQVLEALYARQ